MKTYILYIFVFFISISTFAQRHNERIKALKVAHITEKLDLSEKEAQQFWPIYNAFDKKTSKIWHEDLRKLRQEMKQNSDKLTDAEANELLNRMLKAENDLHIERTQLVEKLRKILSPQKIIQLKIAEEDFKRKLLAEMKKRKEHYKKNRP